MGSGAGIGAAAGFGAADADFDADRLAAERFGADRFAAFFFVVFFFATFSVFFLPADAAFFFFFPDFFFAFDFFAMIDLPILANDTEMVRPPRETSSVARRQTEHAQLDTVAERVPARVPRRNAAGG